MKFETPATTNPIDQLKIVGQPVSRIDGPLKTTGTAPYAYERHDVVANQAYGYIVGAAIGKGRIAGMDLSHAKAAPGVLAIVTADNAGELHKSKLNTAKLLGGPEIQHYHQAIAVVVAESFEQARAAAALVRVDYVREQGAYDLASLLDTAKPGPITGGPGDTAVGDFASAFAAAPVRLDARYSTPDEAHAMMEPHATIAAWEGDKLTLWTSNQMIAWNKAEMATTLGIPKENVRVDSPFIGGGFGGKLFPRADALMAALGARAAKRPVKVALQRPLMFNNTTHRPATIQRIRIGARAGCQLLDRTPICLGEVALQVEVLGRVAGDAELGEDHQLGTLPAGAGDPLGDLRRVGVDVADRRVDLCQGYTHAWNCRLARK